MHVGKNVLLPIICYLRDRGPLRRLVRRLGIGRVGRIAHDGLALRYGETRVRVNGYMLRFRITDEADLHHAENMNGEEEFLARMVEACLPGDTFWDVGAYLGKFSVLVAVANKRKKVRVHAFEPVPRNLRIVQENAQLNSVDEVLLAHQVALGKSSSPDLWELVVTDDFSKCRVREKRSPTATEAAPIATGADFALQRSEPPDVVKIDVEGMEMDVLEGMSPLLGSGELHDVFLEVHPRELQAAGLGFAEVHAFLEHFGFRLVWAAKRRAEFLEHYQR